MLILALDTSQIRGVIVLARQGEKRIEILAQSIGSTSIVHSEGLLSMVDDVLKQAAQKIADVDIFGCGIGPGSFTGIRVGLATIKSLAQVTGKQVVPLSSMRALALSCERDTIPVVNAYQGMVFSGRMHSGHWEDFTCLPDDPRLAGAQSTGASIEAHGLAAACQENMGAATSYLKIHANYIRLSAAEEKLIKRA